MERTRVTSVVVVLSVAMASGGPAQEPQPADTTADSTAADVISNVPDTTEDRLAEFVTKFSYRLLGPASMSGRITAIAVQEPYHKTIYAGSASGGLWKTSNNGTTWRPITDTIGVQSIGAVAVAPSDTTIVWVGTGERSTG